MYSNYDLYGGHKVVLADYRGNSPYVYFKKDKVKYYKFKGEKYRPQQQVFHDNNNHQEHKEKKNGKHDNGNRGHKNK